MSSRMHWLCFFSALVLGLAAAAKGEPLRVVATLPDLGDLAKRVGGSEVAVTVLVKGPQDAHFLEPRPSFVRALHEADLFVLNGMELEVGWVPPLLQSARNPEILAGAPGYVDASRAITPIEVPAAVSRAMGDVHPQGNPHYLTDPCNGMRVAALLRDRLAERDPEPRRLRGALPDVRGGARRPARRRGRRARARSRGDRRARSRRAASRRSRRAAGRMARRRRRPAARHRRGSQALGVLRAPLRARAGRDARAAPRRRADDESSRRGRRAHEGRPRGPHPLVRRTSTPATRAGSRSGPARASCRSRTRSARAWAPATTSRRSTRTSARSRRRSPMGAEASSRASGLALGYGAARS